MKACLLLALATAGQPASQPAAPAAPGGTAADVHGELTVIFELGDGILNTQESWRLQNLSGKLVPADQLTFAMPEGVSKLRLDEETPSPFEAAPDSSEIRGKGPMGPGDHTLAGAYQLKTDGSSVRFRRRVPFRMGGARLILEAMPNLTLTSNVKSTKRTRDLNGVKFSIWELDPFAAGTTLDITIDGLPAKRAWPRQAALALVALIIAWMLWSLTSGKAPGAQAKARLGVLSAQARCDRIVRAFEILEADHADEKISDQQHARRKKALLKELAVALRESELERAGEAG